MLEKKLVYPKSDGEIEIDDASTNQLRKSEVKNGETSKKKEKKE